MKKTSILALALCGVWAAALCTACSAPGSDGGGSGNETKPAAGTLGTQLEKTKGGKPIGPNGPGNIPPPMSAPAGVQTGISH